MDVCFLVCGVFFFFQAEDGIRDLVRSRGLGDVYKRQVVNVFNAARRDVALCLFGALNGAIKQQHNELALRLSLIHI